MYLRTSKPLGLGTPAALPLLKEIGLAVLTTNATPSLFNGGSFQPTSNSINVLHPGTIDRPFSACERQFSLVGTHAEWRFFNQEDEFAFKLMYEYNGNDLKNVTVIPLLDASSGLNKSTFIVGFEAKPNVPDTAPVAEVAVSIRGSWTSWRWSRNVSVTFYGNMIVRADGAGRYQPVWSERGLVTFKDTGFIQPGCAPRQPYVPPPPKPKRPYSLAILFPLNKSEVTEEFIEKLYAWRNSWPAATRARVKNGELTLDVVGFASRPGGALHNVKLAGARADSVAKALKLAVGSNVRIDLHSEGALERNVPDLLDVRAWLTRAFNPNKYDQAAVIRFEDEE